MESVSSSRPLEKSFSSTPVKTVSIIKKSSIADEILTPEKPAELRRPTKKRGVAYSLKEVRKVAASLQQSQDVSRDREERFDQGNAVSSVGDAVRHRLPAKSVVKLAEGCEILLEFFNSLTSSIRLLRLKGQSTSFTKISRQVESLTNRRFSHGHLAQLKYILPEAICIKKILVHDETTSCVKPDLQIILQTNVFEERDKGNGYQKLSQIFRSRLVQFSNEHPGGEDVPGAELPEPFNQTVKNDPALARPSAIPESRSSGALPSEMPSHLPTSFTTRFSRKNKDLTSYPLKPPISESFSPPPKSGHLDDALERTPSKILSTPLKSMVATPDIKTPTRNQLDRRPTRTKLFHTPVKGDLPREEEGEESTVLKFLPKTLLQSVRAREKRVREEQEEGVAASKRRRKMLSCLPKVFNTVLLLFQSAKCSVITKQELLHKIVSSQCDIVDQREVEEQLGLLLELVPDWISGKTASTGDFLFCVNKACDPDALRRKLAEAE